MFMMLQIKQGFSLDRWKRLIDCISLKDNGIPAIDRLRIILLFEADANIFF